MSFLEFREGDRVLFRHFLRHGRTVVGRSDSCDVALPSDNVSRFHCAFEERPDGWWIADRSRNGTRVNGAAIEREPLRPGDRVQIGEYTVIFTDDEGDGDDADHTRTRTDVCVAAPHESLVDIGNDHLTIERVDVEITRGPAAGARIPLRSSRASVGGDGADVVLHPALPRHCFRLRVVRGRAMLEPGEQPAYLDGVRIRELTPLAHGEEVRLGDHGLTICPVTEAEVQHRHAFGQMVGSSTAMKRVFGALERMAAHDACVLVCGESGTGKELAARALHEAGPRHQGPFVAVNCAAIAATLFESELFGHEKGSFTGAIGRQDGAFQRADGGTLFLDEVGELSLDAQAKLLRALESGEVHRVGGSSPEFPDVRVVAATNRKLLSMVQMGRFRQDLYFRLAVLTVDIPPLRERPDDIATLARALLQRQHPSAVLSDEACRALEAWRWPGNARELRNVLTRAFVLGGPQITVQSLSFQSMAFDSEPQRAHLAQENLDTERQMILEALDRAGGNRTHAARMLGMPRSSLLYRLRRLGIG